MREEDKSKGIIWDDESLAEYADKSEKPITKEEVENKIKELNKKKKC